MFAQYGPTLPPPCGTRFVFVSKYDTHYRGKHLLVFLQRHRRSRFPLADLHSPLTSTICEGFIV